MARLPIWVLASTLLLGCGSTSSTETTIKPIDTTQPPTPVAKTGIATINTPDLKGHVEKLASDEYRGRGTNEIGARLAADYLAAELAKYGLKTLPGRNYKIDYTLHAGGFDPASNKASMTTAGATHSLKPGADYAPFAFSADGTVKAPVVFAGYGITAPKLKHDDYKGLDVKGKIVLVLRHYPNEQNKKSAFRRSRHSFFTTKAAVAAKHGAVGMLLVTDPRHHKEADDLRMSGRLRLPPKAKKPAAKKPTAKKPGAKKPGAKKPAMSRRARRRARLRAMMRRRMPRIPAIRLSREAAQKLVAGAGQDLLKMQIAIDGGTAVNSFALKGVVADITVGARKKPQPVVAQNLVGIVEGSDPKLKHEYVVIGGHYDHLGAYSGHGDTIYNGADDNASGTAGVLALARAFASLPVKPKRSLAFMWFSGEEHGLLGSRALIEQNIIPRDKIAFMLNLDMIGRNPKKPIEIVGDGYASGLRKIVEAANAEDKLPIEFGGTNYAGNSDHHPFFMKSIPVMFFFTGLHKDYHQLSDHADKVEYQRMTKLVRVAYNVVERIAGADATPTFIHHIPWLGVALQAKLDGGTKQVFITSVDADSRATKAGLKVGDKLHMVGKAIVNSSDSVNKEFNKIRPGVKIALAVHRAGKVVSVEVERAKRGYLGVMTGQVQPDVRKKLGLPSNEGVLIRGLAGTGPAGKAGIKAGDILVRISGRPVAGRTLTRVLARIGAGEPVQITVVRNGKRLKLKLVLGERPQRRRRR